MCPHFNSISMRTAPAIDSEPVTDTRHWNLTYLTATAQRRDLSGFVHFVPVRLLTKTYEVFR